MIRLRASFFFFFSSALLAAIFFLQRYLQLRLWLSGPILILSALSIVLLTCASVILKRIGLSLLAVSLGLLFAFFRFMPSSFSIGIPLDAVSGFSGCLVEDSTASYPGYTVYRIRLNSIWSKEKDQTAKAFGKVLVIASARQGGECPKLFMGRVVSMQGSLKPNKRLSKEHFISWVDADKIDIEGFRSDLYRWRFLVRISLDQNVRTLDSPASALLMALLFGDREEIPEDIYEWFRASGSLHILALSGLHVGILYLLIYTLLFFIPGKRVKIVIGSLIIFIYLFLVGPRPSLVRAVIMLSAGSLGFLLDRDTEPLNILAFAAAIILLFDPFSAFDLSFQLSFMAIMGILLIGPPISRMMKPYIPPLFGIPLAYSLGAQIATAPLLLSRFGVIYPVGVLVSIILIPLITIFIWTGLFYIIISALNIALLLRLFSSVLNILYILVINLIDRCSRLPGIQVIWSVYVLFFLALILFPGAASRRRIAQDSANRSILKDSS